MSFSNSDLGRGKEFANRLSMWFKSNKRNFPWRNESDPYRILVAEKLLQQTTFGHVRRVYDKFFEKFPDVITLASSSESEIEETIRPLGFHRQRARQFKKIAEELLKVYGGKIPKNKDSLLKLPGIGRYVASAVLCFAFNKNVPIVDVNVRRVMRRLFDLKSFSDDELEKFLEKIMPAGRAKEFNWGIIDFSAIICSRKPKCKKCFAKDLCDYFKVKLE